MLKLILSLLLLFQIPYVSYANSDVNQLKAAFIRDGNLWIIQNGDEKQITKSGEVYEPKWSYDGEWILYQSNYPEKDTKTEIWAYHVGSQKKKKISSNGENAQWAPNKNLISFQSDGILNISTFDKFMNIALGVDSYTWLPNGKGFILSSMADLRPEGWSNPVLYKKEVKENLKKNTLADAEHFFTIPKKLKNGDEEIISISAGTFNFSPSQEWMSFIVSPTASWSMDTNMLCVINNDGTQFQVLDEVIFGVGEPKWAPSEDLLAYIAGDGRLVFGFKNKDLKIKEFPTSGSLTPESYAELDFTWKNNHSLYTSRIKEGEWSNDYSKHPAPALYVIDITNHTQTKITNPPKGQGDFEPQFIQSAEKLVWYRSESMAGKRDLWIANLDGTNARKWLSNVETIVFIPIK